MEEKTEFNLVINVILELFFFIKNFVYLLSLIYIFDNNFEINRKLFMNKNSSKLFYFI
jgi:hypothetical protein